MTGCAVVALADQSISNLLFHEMECELVTVIVFLQHIDVYVHLHFFNFN